MNRFRPTPVTSPSTGPGNPSVVADPVLYALACGVSVPTARTLNVYVLFAVNPVRSLYSVPAATVNGDPGIATPPCSTTNS